MRNPRVLALSLAAVLALVAIPAAALALPGDPSIEPLGPPNNATVSVGELGGVHVTFKCPAYHVEAGDGTLGDYTRYRVRFSTGPARDSDGQLSNLDLPKGEPTPEGDKTICGADFEAPKTAGPTALYQGTVYWQVLREVKREACPSCATETPQQRREREDKELEEELEEDSKLEEEEEKGIFKEPKGELEGGPIWSFDVQPTSKNPR